METAEHKDVPCEKAMVNVGFSIESLSTGTMRPDDACVRGSCDALALLALRLAWPALIPPPADIPAGVKQVAVAG